MAHAISTSLAEEIEQMQFIVHANAKAKGFWDSFQGRRDVNFILKQLAMIHSEVSEVLEAVRKEKDDQIIAEEFADILIRVFDLYEGMQQAGFHLPPLGHAIESKIHTNNLRAHMHGVLA